MNGGGVGSCAHARLLRVACVPRQPQSTTPPLCGTQAKKGSEISALSPNTEIVCGGKTFIAQFLSQADRFQGVSEREKPKHHKPPIMYSNLYRGCLLSLGTVFEIAVGLAL